MGKKKKENEGHKRSWQEAMATVDDIKEFLRKHVLLRYNMVKHRTECRIPSNYDFEGGEWQPLNDRILNSLWRKMADEKIVRLDDMRRIIESDYTPEYHPFKFYLENLPKWDGGDYILSMSTSVTVKGGVENQFRFAQYLKKWLVGMVAGWVDPTVVNNVILVLIGEQGSFKTTWFNYLLPPELKQYFYTKTNANRMGRDDLLTLTQYGLVCCEELDTMRPAELNQLKAAVTMRYVDERAAYAHYHEHREHIASFCGTGNCAQFLNDPTGNRRWLPFEVKSIDPPRTNAINYVGVYSQAYALYQQNFEYWFKQEEMKELQEYNQQFEAPNLEQELVDIYFRKPEKREVCDFMPVGRALQIISGCVSQKISPVALGRAFSNMGFTKEVRNRIRGYQVVQRSAQEINIRLRSSGRVETDGSEELYNTDNEAIDSSGRLKSDVYLTERMKSKNSLSESDESDKPVIF